MCRHLRLLSLFLVVFVAPALALPAPMSDQDLMDTSDLVALVRVLSVTCTTVTKDEQTGEELPGYVAKLKLLEVKKGDATAGDEVLVTWRAVPKAILGPWTVYYYPGEEVLTHLTKSSNGVGYASSWWNAKGEDVKAPESTELPTTPGETAVPPQKPDKRMPL
ncbi:MAG TPA: hypothetical protein DDW26_04740 [Rhizobiales bacterium]|jgi:hypothetical protein|nr:hypothetical protein [Hyphomicrobiales bacterium]